MDRALTSALHRWLDEPGRRPLVIRGARQVGKTWLVRTFAQRSGRRLVELNFERDPGLSGLFQAPDPHLVLRAVSAWAGRDIKPATDLLFLDEIQAAPSVLSRLRWFYEELPTLPVIAAGSLLDFVFGDHQFSMPVGRIQYLYLEPLSFSEFLEGVGEPQLRKFLDDLDLSPAPQPIHERLLDLYRQYMLVGGMPAVVKAWAQQQAPAACAELAQSLIATYRDDFPKYAKRTPPERLNRVLTMVPRLVGKKFKYSQVDPDQRAAAVRSALDLLVEARVCHKVACTDAAGLPLAAGTRDRVFKVILADVGLLSALLGLSLRGFADINQIELVNEGALAEQVIGQALRTVVPHYVPPELYYWVREQSGPAAEVDYLLQHGPSIVPVEVKAGKTGRLRSLHLFMALRALPLAVRINTQPTSWIAVDLTAANGQRAHYTLLNLPFYLTDRIHDLIDCCPGTSPPG